jgi:hypothetical protein
MATVDRFRANEHQDSRRARNLSLRIAQDPRLWFGIAAAGLLAVFAGLIVEASSDSPVVDFSATHPGFLIMATGAFVSAAAVMAGLTLTSLQGLTSSEAVIRRMVPLTVGWVTVASVAVGSITFVAVYGGTPRVNL